MSEFEGRFSKLTFALRREPGYQGNREGSELSWNRSKCAIEAQRHGMDV